jgi:hypothetical protein
MLNSCVGKQMVIYFQKTTCVDCDEFEYCIKHIQECSCGRGPQPHYVCPCPKNNFSEGTCNVYRCKRLGGFKHFGYASSDDYISAFCKDHKPREAVIDDIIQNTPKKYNQ